jgi:hypothetical protein
MAVLLFPAYLLMNASLAVLFVFANAGILVIVGRTAGGFGVADVSANACVCSSSVLRAVAGILVIVGRTAGGFAVAGVSAIACVCGGSVRPCWHAGILVIVGRSFGGVAIAVVSAIACCLC